MRLAAVVGREGAVTADLAVGNGAFRHMLGRRPLALIGHAGDGKTIGGSA